MVDDERHHIARAKQYIDLHDQVKSSVDLLDSLEGFLSTFQSDLTAVSGQISDLQERSQEIDDRLKARKKIERPLSSLLTDLCISPNVATTILDTDVGEPWLFAIPNFQQHLIALTSRRKVRAARDLSEVAEGLRIVAATKIRSFFHALIEPIRTSMTTNMQVLQTSVLVKFAPLYEFLQLYAEDVSKEFQRAYVAAARVYYETGFRRYVRILGYVRTRTAERSEPIATADKEAASVDERRLALADIDGPAPFQAYVAENKDFKEPLEACYRSMIMVLLDNASAEFTFITTFFRSAPATSSSTDPDATISFQTPTYSSFANDRRPSVGTSIIGSPQISIHERGITKADQAAIIAIWKQIMDPTLAHCQNFVKATLDPLPPVIPLLTIIRLTENIIAEVQLRGCPPLENWLFGLRLQFWPIFQQLMTEHISSLVKLAGSTGGSYFKRSSVIGTDVLRSIATRYVTYFSSFVMLTEQEETIVYSNLTRLRTELTQLIISQSQRLTDPLKAATFQSSMFELLLQAMSKSPHPMAHPKVQAELAYWREKEEESRRRILSSKPAR